MTSYNNRFDEECQMTELDEKCSFNQQLSERISKMLKLAESDREIDDIELKFNLHFPPVEGFLDVSYKRPVKESYYTKCSVAGLWSLARKFGNTEKFGLLIAPEEVVTFCFISCASLFVCVLQWLMDYCTTGNGES